MRTLKFRAWNEELKRIISFEELSEFPLSALKSDNVWTFEQYTELKDKNGKEIYDGDIVSVWGCTYKVAFLDNAGMIIVEKIPDGSISQSQMLLANCCFECEVIGNIHENKELLEVE